MIPSTTTFEDAVNGNGRTFRAKMIHDGEEVSCSFISATMEKGAMDGDQFSIGSVFSSSATIVVSGLTETLENEDITLQIGVLNANDVYEYINYAQYTVIKVKRSGSMATLTAVGFISSKLNVQIPDLTAPTLQEVATAIANTCGVTVSFIGISGLTNILAKDIKGITCRAALGIIAFLVGGFATENHTGGIQIHKYAIPAYPINFPTGRSLTAPTTSDETFAMTGVKVIVKYESYVLTQDTTVLADKKYYVRSGDGSEEDPYEYTEVENPSGNPYALGWYETEKYYISGDPIRQTYQNDYMSAGIFTNVFAPNIINYTFMPASVDMTLGDPRLEPWDVLRVTDGNGDVFIVPCLLIQSDFDGGFSSIVIATGETQSGSAAEGSLTRQVDDMAGQLAVAQQAATQAKAAAAGAKASAQRAKAITDEIETYADSVSKTVTQILADGETAGVYAQQAIQDAGEAKQSANQANLYATSALTNLGVVENVLDTLDWITKHGYYQLTADASVVANKIYYSLAGTAITSPTGNPSLNLYYERSGSGTEADPYVYALSTDTAVDDQKTYYSVTAVSIAEPTGNPSENGYYELQMNSALSQYVSTHLSLTDDGLSLLNDNSSGSMLLSTDGVTIKNAQGITVGQYGEGATIGALTSQHISIMDGQINFWAGNESDPTNLVAYVSGQELHIPRVVVVQSLQMGNWRWDATIENHLSLNWIGG